ncbi:hypothetical protein PG995_007637 [Apiospora arundinis]
MPANGYQHPVQPSSSRGRLSLTRTRPWPRCPPTAISTLSQSSKSRALPSPSERCPEQRGRQLPELDRRHRLRARLQTIPPTAISTFSRLPRAGPVLPSPALDRDQNSTGDVGCEPGYNRSPAQHTKIGDIKSRGPQAPDILAGYCWRDLGRGGDTGTIDGGRTILATAVLRWISNRDSLEYIALDATFC